MLVVIGLLLFVIVCELAAIYDRQNGGITVIGGIIEKELDAREKAQQKRIKKYTDKYAKKEVAEA